MVYIRPKNEVVDVSSLYAGAPTWFSIKLHHGGKFTKLPDIKYTGGEVRYVDYVDIDEFSVHELDAIMLDLGYPDPRMIELSVESPVIYYHFRIPNGDFQFGLRALGNDQDVINLSKFIQNNKLIEVYTEHGKTNLLTYFMSPNAKGKVVIEELPENDDQGAKYEAEVHVESPLRNMNHVGISMDKVFRAKDMARKHVTGDYTKQFELLRDYALELQATNPDTTVKIDVCPNGNPASPTRQFRRIYVCLGPLKKGFKACLRDLVGLDGAFMKGPFPGQVLTAVGLDSNNGIYPLAYAIVESENTASWKWFLENLGDDLELGSNSNYTFISDRQKGLQIAVDQLFPNAEHRYCIRHIHDNMRKKWGQTEYRDHLWRCASATTIPEFEHLMKEFSEYDKEACQWLKQIPPVHWARSHFSGRAVSDVLISNMCEVFNGKIEKGRDKPVISCLEFIREYLMKRICNVMKAMKKAKGPLTPTATDILDARKKGASQYIARWNGANKYQVTAALQDQHVVDVRNQTCTCRKWELMGIPCRHAIATLNEMSKDPEAELDIYKWVHKVYWLETWQKAYSFKVEPIKGRPMWPKSNCPTKLIPPPHHTQVGRPKKKRRQSEGERLSKRQKASAGDGVNEMQGENSQGPRNDGVQKLSRKHVSVTCSKCKNKGHNSRTCKGQGGNQSKK
uniref:SWIM-type domain-containing protein n=1 Tax=Lactuca sativa TaxID=4236 RepID=A0A9R1UCY9_LACSA|nr:hypothetical protein LSAT_V11C900494740 [Lactuca sativa]